jgi:hypothetical protein
MSSTLPEADWKVFRSLHKTALERYCDRILVEVGSLMVDATKSPHERYLAVHRLIQERNNQMAELFDDLRRSTAAWQLFKLRREGIITDNEMASFSPVTQVRIAAHLGGTP